MKIFRPTIFLVILISYLVSASALEAKINVEKYTKELGLEGGQVWIPVISPEAYSAKQIDFSKYTPGWDAPAEKTTPDESDKFLAAILGAVTVFIIVLLLHVIGRPTRKTYQYVAPAANAGGGPDVAEQSRPRDPAAVNFASNESEIESTCEIVELPSTALRK